MDYFMLEKGPGSEERARFEERQASIDASGETIGKNLEAARLRAERKMVSDAAHEKLAADLAAKKDNEIMIARAATERRMSANQQLVDQGIEDAMRKINNIDKPKDQVA